MGSTLSRQEELFVNCEWSPLLQKSMTLLAEEDITAPQYNRQSSFCMSFAEWEAFLSLLEEGSRVAVPAAILDNKLDHEKMQCPLVVLVVYFCAWWGGAIDDATMRARLGEFERIVAERKAACPVSSPPASQPRRRDQLTRALQRRLPGSTRQPLDDMSQQLDTQLLSDAIGVAECALKTPRRGRAAVFSSLHWFTCNSSRSSSDRDNGDAARVQQQRCRKAFDALCAVPGERPVLRVAVSLLLAVFAATTTIANLVESGAEQLRMIEQVMKSGADKARLRTVNGATATVQCACGVSFFDRWRLLGELEAALARHQCLLLDIPQCCGTAGETLCRELDRRRAMRCAVNSPHPPASASERWELAMSQFVGQRHIWTTLRDHFLYADMEADKATVIVFFGPSGYGKSEMAKRIASVIHGIAVDEIETLGLFVHIDMPAFCTKEGIYSLVDPPAAHIGDSILLSALNRHPNAVVMLDEFEKSTAEPIQNLWLSAFQKKGTLRSLKNAERSVSTVKTTFILTCNIAAELIQSYKEAYLADSPAGQATLRRQFELECRKVCRELMSEPFVNRVDYFFPFTPYSMAERRQFVLLQLEPLLSLHARRGCRLYVTPRFVHTIVQQVTNFHAATVEEIIKPFIRRMAEQGWSAAVLSVEKKARAGAETQYIIMPAHRSELTPGAKGQDDDVVRLQAWDALTGTTACLQLCEDEPCNSGKAASYTDSAQPYASDGVVTHDVTAATMGAAVTADVATLPEEADGGMQLELARETHTARELELERSLSQAREINLAQERTIARLTEQVRALNKALALMMCLSLYSMLLVSLILGIKAALMLSALVYLTITVVFKIPVHVALKNILALYRYLGSRNAALLGLLLLWLTSQTALRAWRCR